MSAIDDLKHTMARLRSRDGGCPWDQEQTHASLVRCLIDEVSELIETIDRGDYPHMREELGDVLIQIVFHACIAEEGGHFNFDDLAREINEKLIRRHPHVFAGTSLDGTDLLVQWEQIKRQEKHEPAERSVSILDGVPRSLPALFAAERLQERAARVKLRPPRIELPLDVDDPEFLGELLFDLVGEARERGFDAETALRGANERFKSHVARVEQRAKAEGRELESYADAELRAMWEATNGEVQAA